MLQSPIQAQNLLIFILPVLLLRLRIFFSDILLSALRKDGGIKSICWQLLVPPCCQGSYDAAIMLRTFQLEFRIPQGCEAAAHANMHTSLISHA